jgi:hypothetical protein
MEHPMASPHQRPDLAEMAATLPTRAGPTAVDMQAAAVAAELAGQRPYITYDGARWYLDTVPDMFDLGELGEAIGESEANPIGAIAAINGCLRRWLADYPGLKARFRKAGGDMDAYVQIAVGLFEAVAARPTAAPDLSSAGRGPTSTSSPAASPSAETAWYPPPTHE